MNFYRNFLQHFKAGGYSLSQQVMGEMIVIDALLT